MVQIAQRVVYPTHPAANPFPKVIYSGIQSAFGGKLLSVGRATVVKQAATTDQVIIAPVGTCGNGVPTPTTIILGMQTQALTDSYGLIIPGGSGESDPTNVFTQNTGPSDTAVILGWKTTKGKGARKLPFPSGMQQGDGFAFDAYGTYPYITPDGVVHAAPGSPDPVVTRDRGRVKLAMSGADDVSYLLFTGDPDPIYQNRGLAVDIAKVAATIGGGGGGLAERETAGPGIAFVGAPGETPATPTATALADLTGSLVPDTYTYQVAWHNAAGVGPLSVSVSAMADGTHTKIEVDDTITVPGAEDIDELWLYRSDTSDSTPKFLLAVPAVGTSVTFTDDGTVTPGDAWSAGAGRIIETRLQTDAMTGDNISGLEDTAGPGQDELSWPGVPVQANDSAVATRRTLDFKDSASVSWTVTDNPTDKRLEVSAAAAAGGGSGGGDVASHAISVLHGLDASIAYASDPSTVGSWRPFKWEVVQYTVPDDDASWVGGSGATTPPYTSIIFPVDGFYQVDCIISFVLLNGGGPDYSTAILVKLENTRGGGDGEDYIQSTSGTWSSTGRFSVTVSGLMYCVAGGSLETFVLVDNLSTAGSVEVGNDSGDTRLSAYLVRPAARPDFFPFI